MGAQNLIFLVPQFRYDFSLQFLCEKSICVPISGGKKKNPLGPLFFFSYCFFLPFFVFFLAFYIFIFSHFLFIFLIF